MLKKLITPMQSVLLQKQYCPGCTRPLDDQKNRQIRHNDTERVICKCGRIYIFDKELDQYRRALIEEI